MMACVGPFHSQSEPALWELLGRLQPKYRLKYVWEKAKGSLVCAETDPADEENPVPTGHGGCDIASHWSGKKD